MAIPPKAPRRKPLPISADELEALEEEYAQLAGFSDDDAERRRREISTRFRAAGPHLRCGDEPEVEVDIPLDPDGKPIRINARAYVGLMRLRLCEWRQIEQLLDQARRSVAERMRDGGQVYNLGSVSDRARLIPNDIRP